MSHHRNRPLAGDAEHRIFEMQTRAAHVWAVSYGLASLLELTRKDQGFDPDEPWGGPVEAAWTMAEEIRDMLQWLTSQLDPGVILRDEPSGPDTSPAA